MARITSLEPDPRQPGAVRVMVDGRPFCTVPEQAATSAGLVAGADWEAPQAAAAGSLADEQAAWQSILRALARRAHGSEELRKRLTRKGHPPEAVARAIARAQGERLLDDAAFAEQYVASRSARGRGPARLRRDLAALGVARELAEAALRARWAEPDEVLNLAAEVARKRAKLLAGLPMETRRRRLLAYLSRRGFSGSPINALVRDALRAG